MRYRLLALSLAVLSGCDKDCPKVGFEDVVGSRTGQVCEPLSALCSDNPVHDPWVYRCVDGQLQVEGTHPSKQCRCLHAADGSVYASCQSYDLSAECYPAPPEADGPLTGEPCDVPWRTRCAPDPQVDDNFYLCNDGKLEVFDPLFVRCQLGDGGGLRVVYGYRGGGQADASTLRASRNVNRAERY